LARIGAVTFCLSLAVIPGVIGYVPTDLPLDTPQKAGLAVAVGDVFPFENDLKKGSQWSPYAAAFGDGTLAVALLTSALDDPSRQRTVVCFFNTDNTVTEADGHFDDSGHPWSSDNNTLRNDGNPPRIAADKRPGGTRYAIGSEATPWGFPSRFPSFGKPGNFTYDERVVCVQLMDKKGTEDHPVPVPVGRLIDPIYGHDTSGKKQNGKQLRSGFEIRALSDGNFAVTVDDRTENFSPGRVQLVSILNQENGEVAIGPFSGNPVAPQGETHGWSNLAAWKGGFAYRPQRDVRNPPRPGDNTIGFWDNQGNLQGTWERVVRDDVADPLPPANGKSTSIVDWGGASTRIDSDIHSDFIYLAGTGPEPPELGGGQSRGVYVTKIDARTRSTVKEAYASEGLRVRGAQWIEPFPPALLIRVAVCCDNSDSVFVCWEDYSSTGPGHPQVVGRLYDGNLDPVTGAFLVFQNSELGPGVRTGFDARCPTCAMVGGRILVAAQTESAVPKLGLTSNQVVATVLDFQQPPRKSREWQMYWP